MRYLILFLVLIFASSTLGAHYQYPRSVYAPSYYYAAPRYYAVGYKWYPAQYYDGCYWKAGYYAYTNGCWYLQGYGQYHGEPEGKPTLPVQPPPPGLSPGEIEKLKELLKKLDSVK